MADDILLQFSILIPALIAGLLVLSTHVPLGIEVLQRGIVFLDLAIAQVAAFGLVLAYWIGLDSDTKSVYLLSQIIAITAAIIGASFLYQFRRFSAQIQEALIGIVFILAATGSVLVLSTDPHGAERIKNLLVGQILWAEQSTLIFTSIIYVPILIAWLKFKDRLGEYGFYPLFAITVTLSTQLVGVYLVFASLIVPALACRQSRSPLTAAYLTGVLGYILGLILSSLWDLPAGPMIAWSLVAASLTYYLLFHE
ncbi:MAG TPA: zinc/manganese transporter permease [Gammaproteobacteria bacterium]|nr:zinc/manganese transporter permease [Gammaproteobacteria bacterium]